ncbi:MAG: peptidoglycan binding domain-containing protein, partial [Peptoniphilaceae bacterium]|nr:peptidoglycan binding domain-containing protein [Peptoniphilaceae bacterium]
MKKTFKIFFAFIIIILIFIYISGMYFFRDRFMPRTYINGHDFGLTKISEFEKNYSELSKNFVLDIVAKDKKNNDKITAEEIKFEDNIGGGFIKQTPLYWPVASLIDKKYQLDTNLKYDDVALAERLNNLNPVKNESIHSTDAKIIFDKGEFKVEKEVHGDFVKRDELRNAIISHFADKNEKLNLEEENLYIEPSITADSEYIKNQLESYKKLFTKKIIFDFDDRKEEVTGQGIIAMYSKSDDGTLVIDEKKVSKFVENLAAKYDTFRTSRIFNATGIGSVKVDGGIYGWLTDRQKTEDEVIAALNKDEVVTIKPIYRQDAVSRTINDIGNTYIEVDLARQKLWYYNKGNLELETNIVSGNPTLGNGTPTGTDRIWSR